GGEPLARRNASRLDEAAHERAATHPTCRRHAFDRPAAGQIHAHPVEQGRDVAPFRTRTGLSRNCAWPPLRCAGMTSRRATELAALAPKSWRTISISRSMPAVLTAEVEMRPWLR